MRLRWALVITTIVLALHSTGIALAREIRQGDQCVVGADETLTGNLFVLCRTLVIDGHIQGNLIGAATTATLSESSVVDGDVYLVAGQLDVLGRLDKDVHFAGAVLRIHPTARFDENHGDVMSVSLSTTVFDEAVIPGSMIDLGYQLIIEGAVRDEISFWGSGLLIDGPIEGDVDATVGDPQSTGVPQLQTLLIPFPFDVDLINPGLRVTEQGRINGQLRYTGPAAGQIAGELAHEPIYTPVIIQPDLTQIMGEDDEAARGLTLYFAQVAREFITLALIGFVGLLVAPRSLQAPLHYLQTRPWTSLGVGALTFILSFPIMMIVVFLSVLIILILSLLQLDGLILVGGLVLGMLDLGGASLFYFIAIFIARVVVCLAVGRLLVRVAIGDDGSQRILFISLLTGIAVLAVLVWLPLVGLVFNALALFLGLGAIMTLLQTRLRAMREGTPPLARQTTSPVLPRRPEAARQFPPPIIEDNTRPLGMDNLPEGFEWWDDD